MINVGITERGDAGLDFSWTKRLMRANIIISKNLNDQLIYCLIKHKDRVIFHMTCTGWGSSFMEPNVPEPYFSYQQVEKLLNAGFPLKQLVLRVDPIIPTVVGRLISEVALDLFSLLAGDNKLRVRYSFLDMYPHVKERFRQHKMPLPYTSFKAPDDEIHNTLEMLSKYTKYYDFESCAEDTIHKIGCISHKDLEALGISDDFNETRAPQQRQGCLCPGASKVELLRNTTCCQHGCLYCYWKDRCY